MMTRLWTRSLLPCVLFLLLTLSFSLNGSSAQTGGAFLYVNNDTAILNTVSGFGINANGTLAPVGRSPFLTGGIGGRPDPDFSNASIHVRNNFLFVANSLSNNLSAFTIGGDGSLTAIAGSPFATGGMNPMGIVSNPRGTALFVTNHDSNDVSVLSIATTGALSAIPGSPFSAPGLSHPTGLALNASGSLLFVGFQNAIVSYSVDSVGRLMAAVAPQMTNFAAQSLALDRGDRFLFVGAGDSPGIAGFIVAPNGSLISAPGSPIANGTARGTRSVVFHPTAGALYATADTLATVSVFRLLFTGLLQPVAGSPFSTDGSDARALVIHPSGEFAYLGNRGDQSLSVLRVGPNGESVMTIPGSKIPLGPLVARPSGIAIATGIRGL